MNKAEILHDIKIMLVEAILSASVNEIEKQLQGLQREIANLKKDKSTTWEEREGREYRREYVKNKYDVIKTHLDKGQKEILQEEFKKDGYNSLSAGLRQLVIDYLKRR